MRSIPSFRGALAAAAGLSLAAALCANVLILAPTADAFIRSDQPGAAQGSNPLVLVGDTGGAGGALRGLLAFDLGAPALSGAVVRHASLRLVSGGVDGASPDAGERLALHALRAPFSEASATWRRRDEAAAWARPGGDFDAGAALAEAVANPGKLAAGEVVSFEGEALTAAVKASLGGPLGLLVKLGSEDAGRSVFRFGSRAGAGAPQLVVDYAPAAGAAGVAPIPGHPERPLSARYALTAGGRAVEVRGERFGFDVARFDLPAEGATVEVAVSAAFSSYSLKPERHGVAVAREGDVLRFTLKEPLRLVLQVDDLAPLAILATPPEKDAPRPGDPGVLYFPPGTTVAGVIRPAGGQTVYLAPGALVKGRIEAKNVSNVTVRGRGILETTGHSSRQEKTCGVVFEHCSGVRVEGIGIRSYHTWWQTLFLDSRDVSVSHVNIFGVGVNTDGVDIDGVRDFVVENSFIRAEDDGLGWHALDAQANGEPVTERVRANNLVIWNTGAGNGIRIGASMEAQLWRDIVIENVDILMHDGAGICSDFSDWAWCEDLVFRDVRIEKAANPLDFRIARTRYSNSTGFLDERGHYDGLVFENVAMAGGRIVLAGFDADHRIDRVHFNGCTNAGAPVDGIEDLALNPFVTNVRFNQPVAARAPAAAGRHEAEYLESGTNQRPQVTYADASLSGGRGRALLAAGPGDHVEYALEAPGAGSYRVVLRVRLTPGSGKFRLSVNGAPLAREQDLYAASAAAGSLEPGVVVLGAPGRQVFRFDVVGKNAASSGHRLDIDCIELVPR